MFESMYQFGKERLLQAREKAPSLDLLNSSIPILMGVYIFINPFPHITAIKGVCLYLSFLFVCVLLIFRKIDFSFRTPLLIPFCLFTGWVLYGLFFAIDKENSIHDFHAHLLRYIAIYFILINVFNSRKRFVALSQIIIASSTAYSVLGISYFYLILGNAWTTRFSYGETGLMGFEVLGNSVCALVIFSVLLSLKFCMGKEPLRGRIVLCLCLLPQAALIFLVQSRGAFIALFLSLILMLWNNKRVLLSIIIVLFIGVATLSPIKQVLTVEAFLKNPRVKVWLTTLAVVKDYPTVGIGFGNETYRDKLDLMMYNNRLPQEYRQTKGYVVGAPHNVFLNILVRTGYLGLALFLSIIGVFFWMCGRCALRGEDDFIRRWGVCMGAAIVSFLVIGMFEQMFHHVTEGVLYTILAMGTIVWRIHRDTGWTLNTDTKKESHRC